MFGRTPNPIDSKDPLRAPRDVEALERAMDVLDGGVADADDSYLKVTEALVEVLGLDSWAVWLPHTGGVYQLTAEFGP